MLFQPEHIDRIREGEKTVTRRDWADNYNQPREGTVHQATTQLFTSDAECDCFIRIEAIREERLGEMTDADARAEGVADLAAFRKVWLQINGEWDPDATVHVVEFEYVGEERPAEQPMRADGGIETPFPVEGTITPTDYGYSASLPCASEWLTETEDGTDYLQRAVDRAARVYGEDVGVRVRFTAGPFDDGCGDFELLGPVEGEEVSA